VKEHCADNPGKSAALFCVSVHCRVRIGYYDLRAARDADVVEGI
jgi:hypothetical protein